MACREQSRGVPPKGGKGRGAQLGLERHRGIEPDLEIPRGTESLPELLREPDPKTPTSADRPGIAPGTCPTPRMRAGESTVVVPLN